MMEILLPAFPLSASNIVVKHIKKGKMSVSPGREYKIYTSTTHVCSLVLESKSKAPMPHTDVLCFGLDLAINPTSSGVLSTAKHNPAAFRS